MATYDHTQSQDTTHSPRGFYGVSVSWSDLQQVDTDRLWQRLQKQNAKTTLAPQGSIVFFCERTAATDGYINHRFTKTQEAFRVGSTVELSPKSTQSCIFYGTNGSRVRLTHTETGTNTFELVRSGEVIESHQSNVVLLAPSDKDLVELFGLKHEYLAATI